MPQYATQMQASGTIYPCRFVKVSGDNTIAQATANDATCGISVRKTRPVTASTPTANAVSGEPASYWPNGTADVELELGGSVSAGDELISDGNGKGVARATTGTTVQKVGARAMRGGASGEFIPVQLERFDHRPALT